jgi:ERCC4-type nuclease
MQNKFLKELRLYVTQGDADENIWKAISVSAGLMKLQYGIELFESQEISSAFTYFFNFFRAGGDKSKAAEELTRDLDFREAYDSIAKLYKEGVKHPKLLKLKDVVNDEILKNKDLRIIIFSQYRDTATKIVDELSKIKEIKPALFVGQAKKGDFKLSQKEQKAILQKFRDGEHNNIVSTSVGEEGLDIPKVDLVIFYEPVPSAIRTIQRIGRTGRFKAGMAYILVTEGTRDVVTRHIANAKEKRMYKVLDQLQNGNEKESKPQERGLSEFLTKKDKKEEIIEDSKKEIKVENSFMPKIYVDNRENTDLIKELFKLDEIEVEAKQLEVGDIVISENIAIERKAKIDFVNSLLDKRLFPQLLDLARNYRRPVLILEGEENIFGLRNINPNVIRSTISAIAIDLRIPIIYTSNLKETAQMILTITKRVYKDKKEISLVANKSSHSENEELEKFVSTIPKVNVVTAKGLLSHFKSIKELVNSTEKDLVECEGVGKVRAKSLVEFFEREYKMNKN